MKFIIDTAWELVDGATKNTIHIAEIDYRRICCCNDSVIEDEPLVQVDYDMTPARTVLENFNSTSHKNTKGATE